MARTACLLLFVLHLPIVAGETNTWRKVAEGQVGPRSSAARSAWSWS